MIKNYIKIAFRSLLKNKAYVIINTLGLGVALACCIAAYLLLAFNIEFDTFHSDEKVANVFKVHAHIREKNGEIKQSIHAPMPLGPAMAEEIAGVERYTRFIWDGGFVSYGDLAFNEGMVFVDSTFFDMFDFPLTAGSHNNFKNKHSIFINSEIATKYFAKEDPIGKTMILNFQNLREVAVTVGGVLARVPENNTFDCQIILRIEHYLDKHELKPDGWEKWQQPSTFVSLASPENAAAASEQLKPYAKLSNEKKKDTNVDHYSLEHFKDASFNEDSINSSYVRLRMSKIPLIVFTAMAGLILLIACFNLTNTSIAMTTKRLKEVGIRKTVGAARGQIVSQFLFETVFSIVLALVAGVLMSQLIVPAFADMWGLRYTMSDLSGVNLFITLIILVFMASLLAGIYPALFNSKFKPVALLKGAVTIKGTNGLTRTLVSLQFGLSIIMLVAGVVFIQNAKFQEEIRFGYDADKVISVQIQTESEFKTMRDRIVSNPKIEIVSVSDHQVGFNNYQSPVKVDTSEYESRHAGVGKNYFEAMGFTLIEGRAFDAENISEQKELVMVNRAFLDKTGIKDPIDKEIVVHDIRRRICGVIENHIENLYNSKEPEPFVFYPSVPEAYKLLLVRVEKSDRGEVQEYLRKNWKELNPTKPFESQFQDEVLLRNSKQVNGNLKTIFLFLTFLGGLLSASGIFALASLNVAKRTKEIGIRKSLGATANHIVRLINKEFVIILGIAMVIGSVGGYFATDWLLSEIYTYRIAVGILPVALCAAAIFAIGISTTSFTIIKAAKANPVDTLRSE